MKKLALPILCFCLLTGFWKKPVEVSDEQLLKLLGNPVSIYMENSPLGISQGIIDCVRLLADADPEITKDLGKEMSGLFKTECRQKLSKLVNDANRNPSGLDLGIFENRDLAERITALKAATDVSNQAIIEEFQAQEKKKRDAQNLAAQEKQIEEAHQKLAKAKNLIEQGLIEVNAKCAVFEKHKQVLRKAGRGGGTLTPFICLPKTQSEMVEALAKSTAKFAALTPDPKKNSISIPYMGRAEPDNFESYSRDLDKAMDRAIKLRAQHGL